MDRFGLEHSLRDARARVVACERALLSQRLQIRELEQCGLDASLARSLLRTYEQSKSMALFDRTCLTSALATADLAAPSPIPASINDDDHEAFADIDTYHRRAA